MKTIFLTLAVFLAGFSLSAQLRSIKEIYPQLSDAERTRLFSDKGLSRMIGSAAELKYTPSVPGEFNVLGAMKTRRYTHVVEVVRLIPFKGKKGDLLSIYNAFNRVSALKKQLYPSFGKNENIPLFKETAIVESKKKNNTTLADPPPSESIPQSKTMYLRFKDSYFGNTYYEGSILSNTGVGRGQGLLFSLVNFETISYNIVPVMGAGKFLTQLYIEPVEEGILAYSASGANVSDFIANQISIGSVIEKRLGVFLNWMMDGL